MNFKLSSLNFIVCGATSGFGRSISTLLLEEKANIIAVARNEKNLIELKNINPERIEVHIGDITQKATIDKLIHTVKNKKISGIVLNSAGPPAKSFLETEMNDWDEAYKNIVSWKVYLTKCLIPLFKKNNYGRIVYIESASVKQPLENLILSTSMRLAVIGFVKSVSQELIGSGINFNILAPGYHKTPAVDRLIQKKAEIENITFESAQKIMEDNLPMKKSGNPDDFATLALWLLSPLSEFVSGQVYSVDGGILKGTL
ncbi:SDR family oxidoreductase [Bacteroidota bacterium]